MRSPSLRPRSTSFVQMLEPRPNSESFGSDAALAVVLVARSAGYGRRHLDVGVREHDERIRASELEDGFFDCLAGRRGDTGARGFGPGERHTRDPMVLDDLVDGARSDEQRLEHALRNSG